MRWPKVVFKTKVVMDASGKTWYNVRQMPLVLRQNLTHHKVTLIRFVIISTKYLSTASGNLTIYHFTRLKTQLIQSNWLRNWMLKSRKIRMLLFEQWMERVKPNECYPTGRKVSKVHQVPMQMPSWILTYWIVNAPKNQTYDVTYSKSVVTAGDTTQPQIPLVRDVEGAEDLLLAQLSKLAHFQLELTLLLMTVQAITSKTSQCDSCLQCANARHILMEQLKQSMSQLKSRLNKQMLISMNQLVKDQTVNIGETPDASSIGNVSDLPSGTTFEPRHQ